MVAGLADCYEIASRVDGIATGRQRVDCAVGDGAPVLQELTAGYVKSSQTQAGRSTNRSKTAPGVKRAAKKSKRSHISVRNIRPPS